jgi:glutamine amidotransferase
MLEALQEVVCKRARPFLGICVGMQLLAVTGREHGCHRGLGWIAGEVVLLNPASGLRVPHVGWNELQLSSSTHPVFAGLRDRHAYFVHSYHFVPHSQSSLLATADYGQVIAAAVGRDNIVGTQFHPEKSQAVGLRILANFLLWRP